MSTSALQASRTAGPREKLLRISTADAADLLRRLGVSRTVMQGIRPQIGVSGTVVGRARTLRMLPEREDIKRPVNGPINRGLYDSIGAGEVLVVDAMAIESHAVLGDMMLTRMRTRDAAAVVVDGAVRDLPVMADKGLPIFARCSSPDVFMSRLRPWESDGAIQCGGVLVEPGDFILADADGVVVVPRALAESLADAADSKREADAFSQALLAAGFALDDAYPLPAHMRKFLPRYREAGVLPNPDDVHREAR
jgi:regulator of RNase E activity RraA